MPDTDTNKLRHWLWITLLVIIVDQLTKLGAEALLNFREPVAVMPMFNFTLVYNEGAAFSFLSNAGGWQRWFFIVLSSVISIVLIIWLGRIKVSEKIETLAIAMILGGALGNLIDRAIYGHVIDFVDWYYKEHHWPAFNIADSAITVGAILLIYNSFKHHDKDTTR